MSDVVCRTLGHAWHDIDSTDDRAGWPGVPMWLRCERCNTERRDQVYPDTGELVHRVYVYRDDYARYEKGTTRANFRVMLLLEIAERTRQRKRR